VDSSIKTLLKVFPTFSQNTRPHFQSLHHRQVFSATGNILPIMTIRRWSSMSVLISRASMVGTAFWHRRIGIHQGALTGGQLLKDQKIVDIRLALVDSCWNTYASTR